MRKTALLLAVVFAAPAVVLAQPQGMGMGMNGCSDIMEQLCPGMKPGDADFGTCMKQHASEFAAKCRARKMGEASSAGDRLSADQAADDMAGGQLNCRRQAAKACPGLKPGDGAWGPCMRKHKKDFTGNCMAQLERGKQRLRAGLENCREAVAKVCPDMKPGTPEFRQCAKSHEDQLPPKCVRFFKAMHRRAMRRAQSGSGSND